MRIIHNLTNPQLAQCLSGGGLAVLKTDTIYGIVAQADNQRAAERLYAAKKRPADKSCIILLSQTADIPHLSNNQQLYYDQLNAERPTTIVVPAVDSFRHLPHQHGTLAFRVVHGELAGLIQRVGPLLAPSANPGGLPPAKNIAEAVDYFGDLVSIYVDSGPAIAATASRIIQLERGVITTIRP